jgi:hypothetical protein
MYIIIKNNNIDKNIFGGRHDMSPSASFYACNNARCHIYIKCHPPLYIYCWIILSILSYKEK